MPAIITNTDTVVRHSWSAMGNTAHLVVTGIDERDAARVVDAAVGRVEELEAAWSRFREDSEISCFNRTGRTDELGDDSRLLLAHMDAARFATRGAYDARILPHILDLGYTYSLVDGRHGSPSLHGNAVDPGGIGKGLAADIVATEMMNTVMMNRGADGVLVSIGGDMRCIGRGDHRTTDDADRWVIDIERPGNRDESIARIAIRGGGVATSSVSAKRWMGLVAHESHVIDPRTTRSLDPTAREIVQATVVASTGAWAEAFATACLVHDPATALALLDDYGLAGLLVTGDGRVVASSNWRSFTC